MGAFRLHGDSGRHVDIHDEELLRFIESADSLGSDAAYVAQALARLIGAEVHDG